MVSQVTANGFTITTGVGDNGTGDDTLSDTEHTIVIFGSDGPGGNQSSYETWLAVGNTGTAEDFLEDILEPLVLVLLGHLVPQVLQAFKVLPDLRDLLVLLEQRDPLD